ncbi:hypothetical protein B2J93_2697 [Marssonina coronariae]|uniref:Uncharacterized protein n=1 Tax=Diplocarpon coronariae TaxID=2795749 RepID=A0A218Z7V8_9HELO|nr:hypothetical protein B2J93_2697 [Marssonina coronariae]
MADAAVPFSHEASETVVVVVVVVVVAVAVAVVVVMAGVVVEAETVNQSRGSDLLSRTHFPGAELESAGGDVAGPRARRPRRAEAEAEAAHPPTAPHRRQGSSGLGSAGRPPPSGTEAQSFQGAGLGVEPEIPEPWQALADPLRDGDTTLGPIETGAWPALLPCPGPPSSPLASQRRPSSHLDTGGPLHDWGSSPRPPLVAGPRNSLPPSDATANASPDERLASSAHSAARTGETPARRHGTRHG